MARTKRRGKVARKSRVQTRRNNAMKPRVQSRRNNAVKKSVRRKRPRRSRGKMKGGNKDEAVERILAAIRDRGRTPEDVFYMSILNSIGTLGQCQLTEIPGEYVKDDDQCKQKNKHGDVLSNLIRAWSSAVTKNDNGRKVDIQGAAKVLYNATPASHKQELYTDLISEQKGFGDQWQGFITATMPGDFVHLDLGLPPPPPPGGFGNNK